MEVFGVAAAALSLLPLITRGFDIVSKLYYAKEDASILMGLFTAERIRFTQWRRTLGVHLDFDVQSIDEERATEIWKNHIPHWELIGSDFLSILAMMSDCLAYTPTSKSDDEMKEESLAKPLSRFKKILPNKKLDKLEAGVKSLIHKRQEYMNALRGALSDVSESAKFVIHDNVRLTQTVNTMSSLNLVLRDLCPKVLVDAISMRILNLTQTDEPNVITDDDQLKTESNRIQGKRWNLLSSARAFKNNAKKQKDPIYLNAADVVLGGMSVSDDPERELGRAATCLPNDANRAGYVEWKIYRGEEDKDEAKFKQNIIELAKLTCIPEKPAEFRILECKGIFEDVNNSRYGFFYELPEDLQELSDGDEWKPVSLTAYLETAETRPALGDRITLAKKIAQSLFVLQGVSWLHKNISSRSILFLSNDQDHPLMLPTKEHYGPYLGGFGFSRPEISVTRERRNSHHTGAKLRASDQAFVSKNLFQHPAKRSNPNCRYEPVFDVYSLGCVLLEIAFWCPLHRLGGPDAQRNPKSFRKSLVKITEDDLPGQVGQKYAEVVKMCLSVEQGSYDRGGTVRMIDLFQSIIEPLAECVI